MKILLKMTNERDKEKVVYMSAEVRFVHAVTAGASVKFLPSE